MEENISSFGYAGPAVLTKPRRLVVQPAFYGVVFADSADGTLQWKYDLNDTVYAETHVVHVPGSSHPDIAIGSTSRVSVLRPNGTVAWQRSALATWLAKGRLGQQDLLVASGGKQVTAFAANGTRLWQRTGLDRPAIDQVTDGDGDGTPEVYVGSSGDTVAALNARTGETEGKRRFRPTQNCSPLQLRATSMATATPRSLQ